jgi:hypothetical protein
MQPVTELWRRLEIFLTSGIAGSAFTPLRLLTVITLISALVWMTRRVTRWLIDHVLARRGFEIGMREALGAIVRYVVIRALSLRRSTWPRLPPEARPSQSRSNSTSRNASAEALAVAEMIESLGPPQPLSQRQCLRRNGNGCGAKLAMTRP